MAIVAGYIYCDGKRVREICTLSPEALALGPGQFAWIGLVEPAGDELAILEKRFNLHPLAVEDAINARQMPKLEVFGDQLFVVARTAHLEAETICYGETDIFVGHDHIITVRHGSARAHAELRQHLEAAPSQLRHGVDYILHAMLDFIVDGYLPIIETIEETVLLMERHALDSFLSRDEITRIFNLRRELVRFRRILGPMDAMIALLEHRELPCIDANIRPYFHDVLDHLRRVMGLVEGLREVLATVFEAGALLEAQRQGAITRQLAAWAAILAVPTAIAGIYGMNFANMPELRWKYGYYVAVGVIVSLCSLLYVRFRKARWL